MKTVNETSTISLRGHVVIRDVSSGEILLDKHNDINNANILTSITSLLTNQSGSFNIASLAMGNGGSTIDVTGAINYRAPNTTETTGALYNETLRRSVSTSDVNNSITSVLHPEDPNIQDIQVNVTLDYNDTDLILQDAIDNSTDFNDDYIFDEIGLVNANGDFLTHLIFHPIQKSANRKLVIEYTLRVKVGS